MKFKTSNEIDEQATTSNIYKRLTDDKTCAIISACVGESPEEDESNMTHLKADVRRLSLGYNQFKSRWVHEGEIFDEWALLIPNITYKQAITLANKYNQKTIIYKDRDGCKEICVCPFEEANKKFNTGDVVRIFKTNTLNIETAQKIFNNKLPGAVSIPVKGSNKKPFTLTTEGYEVFEMFDPKPSTFQTTYAYRRII